LSDAAVAVVLGIDGVDVKPGKHDLTGTVRVFPFLSFGFAGRLGAAKKVPFALSLMLGSSLKTGM
jgi:hypothetical protein